MQKDSGTALTARALEFFGAIDAPVAIEEFIQLQRPGDRAADALISQVAQMMLDLLRKSGAINCDDPSSPNARIYGLTPLGTEMLQKVRQFINDKVQ